jgi:hypothetical protein
MSYLRKGIFATLAIAMTLGAAQFASGEGLTIGMRTAGITDEVINRAAKTDRAPILAEPVPPTQTIDIHVDRLPSTSVLVRIPRAREAHGRVAPTATFQLKSGERKMSVACEPVVSVLTEIAKQLRPGRCIT